MNFLHYDKVGKKRHIKKFAHLDRKKAFAEIKIVISIDGGTKKKVLVKLYFQIIFTSYSQRLRRKKIALNKTDEKLEADKKTKVNQIEQIKN